MRMPASLHLADLGPGIGIEQVMSHRSDAGIQHQTPEVDQIGAHP